ncbi:MAG: PKD domain-containing protein, partial [Bacteroidota bacterium]
GQSDNFPNTVSIYSNPGTYTVELIATDATGCTDTTEQTLTVFGPPNANFLPSATLACVGQTIGFQDLSTGIMPVDTWLWDFGDGNTANVQNPAHVYTAAGTYTVSLIIFDANGCTDSLIQTNLIRVTAPEANFIVNNAPGCPGTTVSFGDLSTGDTTLVSWEWNFGDGNSSTLPAPSNLYQQAGFYDVSLVVTDVLGCVDTLVQPQIVEIFTAPVADFNMPDEGCIPLQATALDASSSPVAITQWIWLVDGTPAAGSTNANFLLDEARTYDITLQVQDANGCRDTISRPTIVHPLPVVDFTVSDTIGCSPTVLIFTDQSPGPLQSWLWRFGNGDTSDVQHPVYTYEEDGSYHVTLVVTDLNGCTDSLLREDYVSLSRPDGDFTVDYVPDCPPVEATFRAVGSSPYGIASYDWDFGDGGDGLGNPAVYTYRDTGTYDIVLTITDSIGCDLVIEKPAEVAIFGVDVPEPVQTHAVTVIGDESTQLSWGPDLSEDFGAYLVYRQDLVTGDWVEIYNTSSRFDTLYVDAGAGVLDCRNESYCYKVTMRNYCGTEGNLNAARTHCTIEVEATAIPDRIVLNWNNYQGWDAIEQYEIYRVNSYNPATAEFLDMVPGFVNAYVDSSTSCFNSYTYRVLAKGAGALQESWSDTTQAENQKSEPSVATELVRATVLEDRYVELEWKPFVAADLVSIFVEKSADDGATWGTIGTLPEGTLSYIDTAVKVYDQAYVYRLKARDSCGYSTPYSNEATSVHLTTSLNGYQTQLEWTPYREWEDGVDFYEIELLIEATNTWVQLDVVPSDVTSYLDGSTTIDQSEYCYRIRAHERGGNRATSLSNIGCVPVQPELHAPNAFSPNYDGVNDRFFLQGVYIASFHMEIYNRWGQQIFEANSLEESWNGTFNGRPVPEGVYVFKVDAITNTGRELLKNGTVTLIR